MQVSMQSYRSITTLHPEASLGGFDICRGQEKVRLAHCFQDRTVAEVAYAVMNSERQLLWMGFSYIEV